MAEPARNSNSNYDPEREGREAITRPDLHELETGEPSPPQAQRHSGGGDYQSGSAASGGSDSSKSVDRRGLKGMEEGEDGEAEHSPGGGQATQKERSFFREKDEAEEQEAKTKRSRLAAALKSRGPLGWKKYAIIGGIGSTLAMLAVVIVIMFSLFGTLQTVHFSTVLRSLAFARFNYVMGKQYSRMLFDAAVLTDSSRGSAAAKLGNRSLLSRLGGINPDKRIQKLGLQNSLKFEFQKERQPWGIKKTNTFKSVIINGETFSLDQMSKESFNKNYNELSRRQRFTVESKFVEKVRIKLPEAFALNGMEVRSNDLNNLRKFFGIRMWKWLNGAKKYLGKTPTEARILNVDDTVKYVDGADARPKSNLKLVDDEQKELREEYEKAAKEGKDVSTIRSKSAVRLSAANKFSNLTFLATAACLVKDVNQSFQEAGKETEKRGGRFGHDSLTVGDEIKEGHTVAEAAGAESDMWKDSERAIYYKAAAGEPITAKDREQYTGIPNIDGPASTFANIVSTANSVVDTAEIVSAGPILGPLLKLSPGTKKKLDSATCDVILNSVTQYTIAGVELGIAAISAGTAESFIQGARVALTTGLSVGIGIGVADLLGRMIDNAVHSYAGVDYSGLSNGPQGYNQRAVATNYLEQSLNRNNTYGRPGTSAEASQQQFIAMNAQREANQDRPFKERYFAIDNPYSLLGRVIVKMPTSFSSVALQIRQGLLTVGSIFTSPQLLFQNIGSVLTPQASAATSVSLTTAGKGVQPWVWSQGELAKLETPEFSWEANEAVMADMPPDKVSKYDECYADNFILQSDKPEHCTQEFLSTDEALHYRAFNAEACAADSLKETPEGPCGEGDPNATGPNTANTQGETATSKVDFEHLFDPYVKGQSPDCADGTNEVGVYDGYRQGKKIPILLCALSNLDSSGEESSGGFGVKNAGGKAIVNSRVSGAWYELISKAKEGYKGSKGLTFYANSSFRTMSHQQQLCNGNARCASGTYDRVAKPGTSNHQMGLAIDFGTQGHALISNGDKWNDWLHQHAADFTVKNYPAEAWHWCPDKDDTCQ